MVGLALAIPLNKPHFESQNLEAFPNISLSNNSITVDPGNISLQPQHAHPFVLFATPRNGHLIVTLHGQ
jgi:hypothetical protein